MRTCVFFVHVIDNHLTSEFAFSYVQIKSDVLQRLVSLYVSFGVWTIGYFGDSTSLVEPVWQY